MPSNYLTYIRIYPPGSRYTLREARKPPKQKSDERAPQEYVEDHLDAHSLASNLILSKLFLGEPFSNDRLHGDFRPQRAE